jgi:protein ImuB
VFLCLCGSWRSIVFGALYAAEGTGREALEAVAREFSPRIEVCGEREITLDLSGLARLFGDAQTIAHELRRTAADRGLRVRVAIAATRVTARLLVRHRAGLTVIEPGTEAAALAPLPLSLLAALSITPNTQRPTPNPQRPTPNPQLPTPKAQSPKPKTETSIIDTLRRWGLRTLGELAALPADEVAARLGQGGIDWQRLAQGEDPRPLVPAVPEERFEQALDLEWPIEGLEPLSFVLSRLMEPLETHLAQRDRGAAVLHVRLRLITTNTATRTVHERSLQLPAPMRDARALRTLALLDLESHPPEAAIDRVVVAVDPTPGRVVQFSLLTRPLPSPEQLSTLMARLTALMGEGRCGSPAPVDTWQPGAFAMKPFTPREGEMGRVRQVGRVGETSVAPPALFAPLAPVVALRRFRIPVPARVRVEEDKPVRVTIDRHGFSGGRMETAAGPWRTSGAWWASDAGGASRVSRAGEDNPHSPHPPHSPWDRDEWDVSLSDGVTYRVFRERDGDRWFVEGVVD